jgi:hypothetical protein
MIYDKYRGKNTGPQCVKVFTGNILQITCSTLLLRVGMLNIQWLKFYICTINQQMHNLEISTFNHVIFHQHVSHSCDNHHGVSNNNTVNIQIYVKCLYNTLVKENVQLNSYKFAFCGLSCNYKTFF